MLVVGQVKVRTISMPHPPYLFTNRISGELLKLIVAGGMVRVSVLFEQGSNEH